MKMPRLSLDVHNIFRFLVDGQTESILDINHYLALCRLCDAASRDGIFAGWSVDDLSPAPTLHLSAAKGLSRSDADDASDRLAETISVTLRDQGVEVRAIQPIHNEDYDEYAERPLPSLTGADSFVWGFLSREANVETPSLLAALSLGGLSPDGCPVVHKPSASPATSSWRNPPVPTGRTLLADICNYRRLGPRGVVFAAEIPWAFVRDGDTAVLVISGQVDHSALEHILAALPVTYRYAFVERPTDRTVAPRSADRILMHLLDLGVAAGPPEINAIVRGKALGAGDLHLISHEDRRLKGRRIPGDAVDALGDKVVARSLLPRWSLRR